MHVLIVEPSLLVHNVYRLLLASQDPLVKIVVLERMEEIQTIAPNRQFDLAIIGSAALAGKAAHYRALLTDIARWAELPKLVVALARSNGRDRAWEHLPNARIVARPFRPQQFGEAIRALV